MSRTSSILYASMLAGILIGLLLANMLVGRLFRGLPSDFERTQLIINTLQHPEHQPHTVLLGNSILMNGVDANLLNQWQPDQLTYNLSSPGQWYREGALYYQDLPASVKKVVHFVFYTELEQLVPLKDQVCQNFMMYGYQPLEATISLLGDTNMTYFQKSAFEVNIASRDILINFFNSQFRTLLRKDLALERQNTDLFFPSPYTQKVGESALKALIERYQPPKPLSDFRLHDASFEQFEKAGTFLQQKNIQFYLAVFPINPRLENITDSFRKDLAQTLASLSIPHVSILDFSASLDADDFVDHWHPYQSGAEKLTQILADQLAE